MIWRLCYFDNEQVVNEVPLENVFPNILSKFRRKNEEGKKDENKKRKRKNEKVVVFFHTFQVKGKEKKLTFDVWVFLLFD